MNADAVAALASALYETDPPELWMRTSTTAYRERATAILEIMEREHAALAAAPLPSEPETLDHAPGCDVFRIAESWEPYGEPRHCDCGFALWDAKRRGVYNWTPPEGAGKHQWTDAPDDEEAWFCTTCHIVECGRCPHPSSCPAPLPSDTPAETHCAAHATYFGGCDECERVASDTEARMASDTPADGLDAREFRFTTWDGSSLVVTVDDEDPGDIGEPRMVEDYDDATSYISVAALALTQEPRSGDDR